MLENQDNNWNIFNYNKFTEYEEMENIFAGSDINGILIDRKLSNSAIGFVNLDRFFS